MSNNLNTKQNKPEVSIQLVKQIVKKFKTQGFQSLTHHDLAVALSTVGFSQVNKQFGAEWNNKCQKQALKILMNSDYDLNWYGKVNSLKYNNFLVFCSRGDIQNVKSMISCVNSESKKQMLACVDNFKRNALHIAVKQGYDVLAEYLINEGISLNARDRQLKTPLHYCRNQLICQVLINKKAKIIVKDNKMCTPVHYVASGGDYKCLQIILKSANIVNQKDATGKSALFYAIYNTSQQQVNVIRVLLQNGGKVNEQDIYGRTPLHYAGEVGKPRCLPILLRKGASIDIRDKKGKTALDLSDGQQKCKKIILAYCNNKGVIFQEQQEEKRKKLKVIQQNNQKQGQTEKQVKQSTLKAKSKIKESNLHNRQGQGQSQIYTKDINQVSTWIRQKFFVLMKKLQQSGVKAMWHLKRPYVYTGSWAENVQSLEDLYEAFLNTTGPEAAMRAFNLLCPYQKPLPTIIGKSEQAFQSFFGESWFSTDPIQKIRNMHSSSKVRTQLQMKIKQSQDLKTQLMGYRSQIQALQSKVMNLNQQISHYKKVQDQLRRQKNKNSQQYTQILRLMSQNQQLKTQLDTLTGGQQKTKILSNLVQQLRTKNQDLIRQMQTLKTVQAAARRKCGQIFLKSLALAQTQQFDVPSQQNLYDDDAIISLYNLLKNNPPNLQKRFKLADKRGNNKLTIDQFTIMLEDLSMLPQDVMSMHRITGFAAGRKTLSLQQFKTILQNRHKNRPMWQKKLIRKIKTIILQKGIKIQKFFQLMDKDGSGTIEAAQLRKGLQQYNIFMNQTDWSNLFNLLDSDNSGQIDLNQLKTLMQLQKTGKLQKIQPIAKQQQDQKSNQNKQSNKNIKAQQQKQKEQSNKEQQKSQKGKQNRQAEYQSVQPYQQKDSQQQQGIIQLNGTLKIGVGALKFKGQDNPYSQLQQAYLKFSINQDAPFGDPIKKATLTSSKISIRTQVKLKSYKVQLQAFKVNISIWKQYLQQQQDENQDRYIGQIDINLKNIIEHPYRSDEIKKYQKYSVQATRYDKEINATIYLVFQWHPQEVQEQSYKQEIKSKIKSEKDKKMNVKNNVVSEQQQQQGQGQAQAQGQGQGQDNNNLQEQNQNQNQNEQQQQQGQGQGQGQQQAEEQEDS